MGLRPPVDVGIGKFNGIKAAVCDDRSIHFLWVLLRAFRKGAAQRKCMASAGEYTTYHAGTVIQKKKIQSAKGVCDNLKFFDET